MISLIPDRALAVCVNTTLILLVRARSNLTSLNLPPTGRAGDLICLAASRHSFPSQICTL